MERLAGRPIERFTPHGLRRTSRSNTKRLKVDFETAEAMLNHVKKGLERTYDRYDMEEEKRAWFLKLEMEIAPSLAARARSGSFVLSGVGRTCPGRRGRGDFALWRPPKPAICCKLLPARGYGQFRCAWRSPRNSPVAGGGQPNSSSNARRAWPISMSSPETGVRP